MQASVAGLSGGVGYNKFLHFQYCIVPALTVIQAMNSDEYLWPIKTLIDYMISPNVSLKNMALRSVPRGQLHSSFLEFVLKNGVTSGVCFPTTSV